MLLIFVALGTDEHPFSRALEIVEPLTAEHELVVQHGHTPPQEIEGAVWHEFMPYDDVVAAMTAASTVVCHAGVGTIMTALGCGKRPLVVVRERSRGEHVDDHQRQIAAALSARGLVVAVDSAGAVRLALEEDAVTVAWEPGSRRDDLRRAVARAVSDN